MDQTQKKDGNIFRQMLLIFAVLSFLSAAFVIWRGCQKPEEDPRDIQIRELIDAHRRDSIAHKRVADSLEKKIQGQDSVNIVLKAKTEQSSVALKAARDRANYFAGLYDSAKSANDTSSLLVYCDSVRHELATVNQAIDTFVKDIGHQFDGLYEKIRIMSADKLNDVKRIQQQDSTIAAMYKINKEVVQENIGLKKKVKSERRKGNAKGAIGFGLGAVIRGLFK